MSALLLAFLAAAAVRIESVAVRPVDGHPGLVVSAHRPLPPVVVSRQGRRLLIRIPGARLSSRFDSPRLYAWKAKGGRRAMQADGLRVWQARDDVLLQFAVGPEVPFGVHQEGSQLRFSFHEPEAAPSRGRSLLVAEAPSATPPPVAALVVPSPAASPPVQSAPSGGPAYASLRAAATEPVTVTLEKAGPRAIVRIRGGSGLPDARVRREGGEVIVTFDIGALAVPPAPAVEPPVDEIHVEKVATLAVVQVKIAPEVPFEIQREPRLLSLTFGEENPLEKLAPAPPAPGMEVVEVAGLVSPEVYRGLFPATFGGESGEQAPAAASDLAREGLQVGPVHLRPSVLGSYVNGDYTLTDTPDPVSDRYVQLEPRIAADMPVLGGELVADYGVRLRFFSDFEEINSTSHLLNARLEMPIGSRTMFYLRDHFSTGILEATEVDPGQEYFFDLSRFRRNEIEAGVRVEVGARGFLEGDAGYNEVDFEDPQGFYPYEARFGRVGGGLTFGDNLRAGLYYGYDEIPAPAERPLVAATGHSLGIELNGDLGALTTGQITLDYTDRDSAAAGAGGQSYRGLTGGLSISRELSPSSRIVITGRRSTDLSAFEDDAFYVSTGGRVLFSFGLPWSVSANTGVGYQENDYRTAASEIGVPREDSIFGWTLGLSRPVGDFAFLRADYRRDRRRSNLPAFNITTDGFIVQMGVGLFGTSVRR